MDISTQKQLRDKGQPAFCYLCGETLIDTGPVDRDHCPPKGFFAPADRINFPVILPTHVACNNSWHVADELVGILTDALHTRKKSQDLAVTQKLEAWLMPFEDGHAPAVTNLPILPIALRIVRGMHALLYNAHLPLVTRNKFHIPLPQTDRTTGERLRPLDQTFVFGSMIHKAIVTGTADVIRAYNGNFRYACTWVRSQEDTAVCLVAFDIYLFHALSPKIDNFPRCFVGMYIPEFVPPDASWMSTLEVKVSRAEAVDPFQRK